MASILEIILKAVKSGSGFKDTEKEVTSLSKATAGLNKILGAAGLAVGAKELLDFGVASVEAARESAAANAELEAALTSSGKASAEYKSQLDELATALENTTLFSDEQVQQAEATLVSFKNLGQDVMPQTIAVVADMGAKMGDLGSAAQLAGKLLDSPAQAAARAQRAGILFTQQQKDQIAAMLEVGNTAGAQGVILDALATKYGGQAAAAREAAGFSQEWAVATGRLHEEFGKLLLAMGDSGVGGASVGLVNTLTEGSTIWASNVEQIQLFVDALNNANAKLDETSGASTAAAEQVGLLQQIQIGWGIILQDVASKAIESTVGWEALAESYGELNAASAEAAAALAAIESSAGSAEAGHEGMGEEVETAQQKLRRLKETMPEVGAALSENRMEAAKLASTYADLGVAASQTAEQIEGLAAQKAAANQGQLDLRAAKESSPELGAKITENRKAVFEMAQDKEEAEQTANQRAAKQMATAFQQAADDIGNAISSKLTTTFQEVFKLPEGTTDEVDEPARRLATVAAAGFGSEWLTQLNTQFTGQAFWQPMATAIASGDEGQLKTAATGILQQFSQGLITDLFDVNVIRAQVRAEMVQKRLKEQLIEEVKQGLGTAGVASAVGVVEVAAGNVGVATAQTETNVSTMAATAEAAGGQIQTAFAGAQQPVDILIVRIRELNNLLRETAVLSRNAAGGISGLNPPNAPAGARPPNGAERRMGGPTPL